jgi:hypothetical protein
LASFRTKGSKKFGQAGDGNINGKSRDKTQQLWLWLNYTSKCEVRL